MTIDFWGLGLQAVNVLILVWLLSRVFWQPVSAAIAKRQETAQALITSAQATQAKADAALSDVTKTRANMAAERTALLDKTRVEADAAAKATLTEARTKADALLATARDTIAKETEVARKANDAAASDLALTIAADLLGRMAGPAVQAGFLPQLVKAIATLPPADRTALAQDPAGIEIVAAQDPGTDRKQITDAVQSALGAAPAIRFTQDSDLIAGLELRSPHFALRNSWQADLAQIRKAVTDAA